MLTLLVPKAHSEKKCLEEEGDDDDDLKIGTIWAFSCCAYTIILVWVIFKSIIVNISATFFSWLTCLTQLGNGHDKWYFAWVYILSVSEFYTGFFFFFLHNFKKSLSVCHINDLYVILFFAFKYVAMHIWNHCRFMLNLFHFSVFPLFFSWDCLGNDSVIIIGLNWLSQRF